MSESYWRLAENQAQLNKPWGYEILGANIGHINYRALQMRTIILFTILLLQACASAYIAPTTGDIAQITYDASNANKPPVIFKFDSYDCKSAQTIGAFYSENQRINEIKTTAKANELFINTFRYHSTSPDFIAGGNIDHFDYATIAFTPNAGITYEVIISGNKNIEVFSVSKGSKKIVSAEPQKICKW